jgi:hypothetical protein
MVGTYTFPLGTHRWHGPCPGEGNHPNPVRREKFRWKWFKRIKEVWIEYPESGTVSHWIEQRQKDGSYKFLHSL